MNGIIQLLMRLDENVRRIRETMEERMANRKRSDSDWSARQQEEHEQMKRLLERRVARDRELAEQEARRRERLRRLTFGLLGR